MKKASYFLILVCILMVSTVLVAAEGLAISAVLMAEDVGNGYSYAVPSIATFSTNVQEGESVVACLITVDAGATPVVYCNGVEVPFEMGTFFENGDYELYLYKNGDEAGDYGLFTFTVLNSYADMIEGTENLSMTEHPDMDISYNPDTGIFTYTFPNAASFTSTVPHGARANAVATLTLGDDMTGYLVWFNGELQGVTLDLVFKERGDYIIEIACNELGLNGSKAYKMWYCFSLGDEYVGAQTQVNTPYGFTLDSATWNGQELALESTDYYTMLVDGRYEFTYSLGDVYYSTVYQRDATPPALFFNVDLKTGELVTQEVVYTVSEVGATVEVKRNNAVAVASQNTLAQDGAYELTITDRVGNSRTYEFTLRKANDAWWKYLYILPVLLVLFLLTKLPYHQRVR